HNGIAPAAVHGLEDRVELVRSARLRRDLPCVTCRPYRRAQYQAVVLDAIYERPGCIGRNAGEIPVEQLVQRRERHGGFRDLRHPHYAAPSSCLISPPLDSSIWSYRARRWLS